ncbi:MAG: ABC transporter permease, partial [Clostridiaceae bacterium]|nr:ABC transporter permease [Clostridiaceae bacterium]
SPIKLLMVELSIYIVYCMVSMITLIPAAMIFWKVTIHGTWSAFLGSWLITMISTLSIGMMVGGVAKNAKSASVIACLLYFPMLIFSGTTLPFEVMPEAMQKIVSMFPMTQGIQLMKVTFLGLPVDNIGLPVVVMGAVTILCTVVAIKCFKWE